MNMENIYGDVMNLLKKETTKISKKAFDILNRELIAGIVKSDNTFWFESYTYGNDCPTYIYDYLVKFIKRKLHLNYLYD